MLQITRTQLSELAPVLQTKVMELPLQLQVKVIELVLVMELFLIAPTLVMVLPIKAMGPPPAALPLVMELPGQLMVLALGLATSTQDMELAQAFQRLRMNLLPALQDLHLDQALTQPTLVLPQVLLVLLTQAPCLQLLVAMLPLLMAMFLAVVLMAVHQAAPWRPIPPMIPLPTLLALLTQATLPLHMVLTLPLPMEILPLALHLVICQPVLILHILVASAALPRV